MSLGTRAAATALAVLTLVSAFLTGCGRGAAPPVGHALEAPRPVVPPPPVRPDPSTPESAVRSYLAWTSYAYVVGESDVASKAVDPYELVHVDSYIEYNRENGAQAIYQILEDFRIRGTSTEGTHTLLAASEKWRYRYFSLKDQSWLGPVRQTSYVTTYTLFPVEDGFIVGGVEASATTPVY